VSEWTSSSTYRALVAGVNLTMRAETTAVLAKAGMLTQDGRCKTLDSSADGYARGEACVVRYMIRLIIPLRTVMSIELGHWTALKLWSPVHTVSTSLADLRHVV
jgi:Beta-ketoacyl synthase, N-terminal domain